MARKKPPAQQEENTMVTQYEPTPQERDALDAMVTVRRKQLPAPKIKVGRDPKVGFKISMDHPDPPFGGSLLCHALATTSLDFTSGILTQISNAVSKGPNPDQDAINFALAVVAGVKPRDEVETMLAAQMAAIHTATMTFARRLAHVENIPQQDSAERALNKLTRTFAMQMEALKRYRTGGEQKVTVHHVTVNEGGQAIVGTVEQVRGEG